MLSAIFDESELKDQDARQRLWQLMATAEQRANTKGCERTLEHNVM
jgi:hypothetical protein